MRLPIRSLATLLMLVGVATCSDTPIATVRAGSSPSTRSVGRLAISAVLSKSAEFATTHLADFPTLRYDSVRVVLRRRPGNDVFLDTTVAFTPASADLPLNRDLDLARDGRLFDATMEYRTLSGAVIFSGSGQVEAYPANDPPPAPRPITIAFVGPGARAKTITVAPKSLGLLGNQSAGLTVTAVDSSNNPISVPIVGWTSSATSVATVSETGLVQGQNRRGTATITVVTPAGISDNASVSVTLPPSAIAVVSGSGQSGRVGSTLPNPAVVQVSAVDGVGVAGVSVIFAGPSGGSVTPTTATTDASGRASVSMKLGTVAGPQGFTATAAGLSTAIGATATAGDPSVMTIVAGNNQSDSVHAVLAPLSVRVTDSFNNVVPGTTVSWSKTGGGTLASVTTTTNTDGIATNGYTLGGAVGAESVTASTGSATATFTLTTGGGRPAAITAVSGNGQTGRVSQPLANPMTVKVTDASGNPVRNAPITWSAQNATITTTTPSDANGQASANVTLGSFAGSATVTAAIAGAQSVSFTATAQPGLAANVFFTTQPTNGVATQGLAPVRVSVRDAGNNAAEGAVTISLGNNPNGAVLGGTLTQPAVSGVATFGNLTVDRAGSGYTLRAAVGAGVATTSTAFNVASNGAGVPAQLVLVPSSPTSFRVTAGQTLTLPQVKVVDNQGNGVPNIIVHAAVDTGVAPNVVVLASGDFPSDAAGLVTLPPPLTTDAGIYRMTATTTAIANASVVVTATIDPGPAAGLKFIRPIGGPRVAGIAGTALPIAVAIVDAYGNVVTSATSPVSIRLNVPPDVSGASLSDTSTVNPVQGIATFSSRSISKAAIGYSLAASSGSFGATSAPIDISAAAAARLAFVPIPTGTSLGQNLPVNVQIQDTYGNVVPASGTSIALTSTPSATVTGAGSSSNGNAGFTVSFPSAGSFTLNASSGTSLIPASATVSVTSLASALRASTTEFVNRVGDLSSVTATITSVDASTNPVGAVPVTFTVANGTCTIASTTGSSTDGSGNVSATINVPGGAGSCAIRATSTAVTGGITFTVVNAPNIATHVWMGSVDDNWNNISNWRVLPTHGAGVPSSSSPVYIPKNAYTAPKLRLDAAIGTLMTEAGSTFDMGAGTANPSGYTLTVAGSVDVAGTFAGIGTMILDSPNLATIRLASAPSIVYVGDATNNCRSNAATYSLSGNIAGPDQLWIRCPLTVAGKSITTGNLYTSTTNGVLIMTNVADSVRANADVFFLGGDETNKLTAGVLELSTYFQQGGSVSTSFVPSGTHRTKFVGTSSGSTPQQVTFGSRSSYFERVEVTGLSPVTLMSDVEMGSLWVSGASKLDVHGQTLTVIDSMRVSGTLDMSSAYATNAVKVGGNVFFDGISSTGHLQSGRLEIAGNFTEAGTVSTAFAPGSGFTTAFNGAAQQQIRLSHPGQADSRFDKLEISNTSVSGVSFESNMQINAGLDLKANGRLAVGSSFYTTTFASGALLYLRDSTLVNANGPITAPSLSCQRSPSATVGGFNGTAVTMLGYTTSTPTAGVCVSTPLP